MAQTRIDSAAKIATLFGECFGLGIIRPWRGLFPWKLQAFPIFRWMTSSTWPDELPDLTMIMESATPPTPQAPGPQTYPIPSSPHFDQSLQDVHRPPLRLIAMIAEPGRVISHQMGNAETHNSWWFNNQICSLFMTNPLICQNLLKVYCIKMVSGLQTAPRTWVTHGNTISTSWCKTISWLVYLWINIQGYPCAPCMDYVAAFVFFLTYTMHGACGFYVVVYGPSILAHHFASVRYITYIFMQSS